MEHGRMEHVRMDRETSLAQGGLSNGRHNSMTLNAAERQHTCLCHPGSAASEGTAERLFAEAGCRLCAAPPSAAAALPPPAPSHEPCHMQLSCHTQLSSAACELCCSPAGPVTASGLSAASCISELSGLSKPETNCARANVS